MIAYDSKLIYEFADRLYRQANGVIVTYAVLFALIGGISGFVYSSRVSGGAEMAAILAVVFALIGYYIGVQKAFALKLQAQTALCQVKIEENARRS